MEGLSHTPESVTEGVPPAELGIEVTNPYRVVNSFLNSPEFQEALDKRRVAAQETSPDVTDEEIEKALLGTETIAERFYHHAKRQGFKFNPSEYSPETQEKIRWYWQVIKELRKDELKRNLDASDIEFWNAQKRQAHAEAAQQLVDEGIAPTYTIAREMVAVLTENKGLGKRSSVDSRIRSAVPEYRRAA